MAITDETFQTVLDAVQDGQTLKAAIANAKTSWRALQLHMASNEEAASRYARARSDSAHFYADKAQEAAERAWNGETATVARIQADVYKWRAAMANPREYGDKVSLQADVRHTVSGVIALPPEDDVPALPRVTATIVQAIPDAPTVDAHVIESTPDDDATTR